MTYVFEGFENAQTKDDLISKGYSLNVNRSAIIPGGPNGGNCFTLLDMNTASSTSPQSAFIMPIGETVGSLWDKGGATLHMRGRIWGGASGSGTSASMQQAPVFWNGNYWAVSCYRAPGMFRSTNLSDWEFVPVSGIDVPIYRPSQILEDIDTGMLWFVSASVNGVGDIFLWYGTPESGFSRIIIGTIDSTTGLQLGIAKHPNGWYGCLVGTSAGSGKIYTSNMLTSGWIQASIPLAPLRNLTSPITDENKPAIIVGNALIYSSVDGITWTSRGSDLGSLVAVAASDDMYVAVGSSTGQRSIYSTDGINWTASPDITSGTMTSVTYGNGIFIACDTAGQSWISSNGINWSQGLHLGTTFIGDNLTANVPGRYTFVDGRHVYCFYGASGTSSNLIASTADGTDWRLDFSVANTPASSFSNLSPFGFSLGYTSTNSPRAYGFTYNASTVDGNAEVSLQVMIWDLIHDFNVEPASSGTYAWKIYEVSMIPIPGQSRGTFAVKYYVDNRLVHEEQTNLVTSTYLNLPIAPAISRYGIVAHADDIVLKYFDDGLDPIPLGECLIVEAKPNADAGPNEWTRSEGTTSNYQAVATDGITNSTTYVSSNDADQVDVYGVSGLPNSGYSVAAIKNEAYFGRLLNTNPSITVGTVVDGISTETDPVAISSAVGSYTYVQQQLEKNPQTNQDWTLAEAESADLSIRKI